MTSPCELVEAVLLVGGLGTRLRPLTYLLPKPLLPVGNIPLVAHQLRWLADWQIPSVCLAAGYQARAISQAVAAADLPADCRIVVEPEPLDTAGAIKLAASGTGTFLAANGDLILNPPLDAMVAVHRQTGAIATILLRRVQDVSHYGLVVRDDAGPVGRVVAFLEKQPTDPSGQRTVNAGLYILEPHVLDHIPPDTPWSVERQLFPRLVRDGAQVVGFLPDKPYYWLDVGRLDTYLQANFDAAAGKLPWLKPVVDQAAQIAADATVVEPVIIGQGAVVDKGAVVGPDAVVGERAFIGAGARVVRSVVWPGARVGPGAVVEDCVIAGVVAEGQKSQRTVVMPSDCRRHSADDPGTNKPSR